MKDIYHFDNVSVVVDNNVLVDLYELGCLNLIFAVFDRVIIPQIIYDEEVFEEIKKIIKSFSFEVGHIQTEVGLLTYEKMTNDKKFKSLSRQDKFAIAIAKENMYYCNSNDKPVRKACEMLDVKYTGTLGVLGGAYIKKKITKEQLETYLLLLVSDQTSCFIDLKIIERFKKNLK